MFSAASNRALERMGMHVDEAGNNGPVGELATLRKIALGRRKARNTPGFIGEYRYSGFETAFVINQIGCPAVLTRAHILIRHSEQRKRSARFRQSTRFRGNRGNRKRQNRLVCQARASRFYYHAPSYRLR